MSRCVFRSNAGLTFAWMDVIFRRLCSTLTPSFNRSWPLMRLLICGDRNWNDPAAIQRELVARRESISCVIHGAARGADSMAGEIAKGLGLVVAAYPAQWDKYGRAAGYIRNRQMLVEGKPDSVFAFHERISTSKGTKHMMEIAAAAGVPVILFPA